MLQIQNNPVKISQITIPNSTSILHKKFYSCNWSYLMPSIIIWHWMFLKNNTKKVWMNQPLHMNELLQMQKILTGLSPWALIETTPKLTTPNRKALVNQIFTSFQWFITPIILIWCWIFLWSNSSDMWENLPLKMNQMLQLQKILARLIT